MKTLFIEAKYKGKIDFSGIKVNELPKKIGLATNVQFADCIDSVKKFLEQKKKEVFTAKGNQKYECQILGCDVSAAEKVKDKVDAFLYIGDGRFHPIGIFTKTKKDVFCFNPITSEFKKLEKFVVENYEKRKKTALIKFYSADNVGILISTKQGQRFCSDKLKNIEKKYKDKKFYKFVFDVLDVKQLENFPFIKAWINTACPRIEEDFIVLNIGDLK